MKSTHTASCPRLQAGTVMSLMDRKPCMNMRRAFSGRCHVRTAGFNRAIPRIWAGHASPASSQSPRPHSCRRAAGTQAGCLCLTVTRLCWDQTRSEQGAGVGTRVGPSWAPLHLSARLFSPFLDSQSLGVLPTLILLWPHENTPHSLSSSQTFYTVD